MNSTTDKIKGNVNVAVGKTKQAAGEALDDPKLKAEGKLREVRGEAQKAVGEAKDTVKRAARKLDDNL